MGAAQVPSSAGAGTPPSVLEVGVLGRVRATTATGTELALGGPRQRALLALLAIEAGRTVPTTALIDAVWDGDPPAAADRTFRTYVSRLRKALGPTGVDGAELVVTDAAGYRLHDARVDVDAHRFEEEVAQARARLTAGEAAAAATVLAAALQRWEGRALGSFADRPWAAPTRVRLEEQRQTAEELLVRALLDADRIEQAVARAEQLTASEPMRESVARLHALALYRAGRDADALRVAREFRARLAEDHGLDPSARLAQLESMVLDRDPRLDRSVGGRRLRGYVLHEPVAHSPLGTVHRAEQPSIGREVAITVLPPERADAPDVVRAFEARVQAVAGLEHPHLLPVYDYWREPGAAYVVTRFPTGGTLAQWLRRTSPGVDDVLRIGGQVAAAMAAAHEAGVRHGALDPDAVVVDERGDAFLWAFSLEGADHAAADVARLAELVTTMTGECSARPGRDGGVATAHLPEPAATAVAEALAPSGEVAVSAAGLAAALVAAGRGEDTAGGDGPMAVSGPNPYRGLAAFREADAAVFFGRDTLVTELRARVARTRAVAVVGPSGSGKSSVVRAGLLPGLRAEGAFVTTMVPGTRPLAELEVALSRVAAVELTGAADEVAATPVGLRRVVQRALPAADGELVLVVDQFEELFTIAEPSERDLLLAALLAAVDDPASRIRVVVTVRADFLGRVLSHPTAGPLVRDRSVMVTPLTDDELHEVVVGPAEVAGVAVEPALATAIVADATRFPASLPMVQFSLTEVFAAADDGIMRLDAYRRIGGIEGVLGQRAEEVHAGLDTDARRAAQALFERLVVPNDDGPPTRRRALRSEFSHVPDPVIDAFGRARLLRFDNDEQSREPTVEVTHEALFRAWPRLVAWIDEGIDDLRTLGHLTVAATDWDGGGRAEADLYRGNRLDTALAYAATRRDELSATERDFLEAARARRVRDDEADRRTLRRLQTLTGALAVGLVLALVGGSVALVAQRREAATRADAQADALAFAATVAVEQDDVALASLLAAEAYAAAPDIESQGALLDVLGVDARSALVFATPSGLCSAASGDASEVAFPTISDEGPVIEVRNLDGVITETMPWREPNARCVTLSPASDHLVQILNGALEVDDRETGENVAARDDVHFVDSSQFFDLHPSAPEVLLLRDDGTVEFATLPLMEPRVTGQVGLGLGIGDPDRPTVVPAAVGYSEDGSLAFAAEQGTLLVLATDDGGLVATHDVQPVLPGLNNYVHPFVSAGAGLSGYVADDELVVTEIGGDGEERRIDLGSTASTHGRGVAVEPGGRRAAVPTEDGVVVVDLEQGQLVGEPLPADTTSIDVRWAAPGVVVALGPNGVFRFDVDRQVTYGSVVRDEPFPPGLLLVAPDGSGVVVDGPELLFFDTGGGEPLVVEDRTVPAVVWPLPDGRWIAVRRDTGGVRIGDVDGVLVERQLPTSYDVPSLTNVAVVGDRVGVNIASIDGDAAGFVLDGTSGEVLQSFESDPEDPLRRVDPLGPDLVLVTTASGTMTVYDDAGRVVDEPRVVGVPNGVVAGSPDGRRYVSADFDGTLNVVDRETGEVTQLVGAFASPGSVDFVDENRIVSSHGDGVTYLWDVSLGRRVGELWSVSAEVAATIAVDQASGELLQPFEGGLLRLTLQPDAWLDAVCRRVSRPLTGSELEAVVSGAAPQDPCGASGGSGAASRS